MSSLYVTEAGAYIKLRGGHVVIGRNHEVLFEVPLERVEDVTLINTVQISSYLLTVLMERGIPITWLSNRGKYYGTLINTESIDILKHRQQFCLYDKKEFRLGMARKLVLAKVKNQLTALRRYNRNTDVDIESQIINIRAILAHVSQTTEIDELMGYEGIIGRCYFEALGKIVPEEFAFEKRTKRPPKDPFNAMISFGYSLLFNEILAGVNNAGLHPFIGCLHGLKKGHPALVSDLIEEWRAPIVDSMVLSIVRRNMIETGCFDITEEGCYLNMEGRRLFLAAYNKKIRSMNQYFDDERSYRESIFKQCKMYGSAIVNEDINIYTPLEIY
ncbi:CRISPR-associated endonuclease Cas1 [Colibacter massiliensis]|uniref:CRISPR-associated endonuclease Cas1 n=1 Tax=Colibacter massiliensis TaxID=1852379 RepID=UPI00266BC0D2|nr:CRISPR-associated endonuclease Cas1 [Colibacter massiliensis]